MNGKGSTPRPIEDKEHFDSEYDRIFKEGIFKASEEFVKPMTKVIEKILDKNE